VIENSKFKIAKLIEPILILISKFLIFPLIYFYSIIRSSGSCSCSVVLSRVFLISDFPFLAPFFLFKGRKHFSASANIFHRPQTFLSKREHFS
jgi:hypothetical protein